VALVGPRKDAGLLAKRGVVCQTPVVCSPEDCTMKFPAVEVWTPRLQGVSDRVKGLSGRIKVWTHEQPANRFRQKECAFL